MYFLFQPAEENGSGRRSVDFITDNDIQRSIRFTIARTAEVHGDDQDALLCFASRDDYQMTGTPSHASEPENERIRRLPLRRWCSLLRSWRLPITMRIVLSTIVQIAVGEEEAFGVSASEGRF